MKYARSLDRKAIDYVNRMRSSQKIPQTKLLSSIKKRREKVENFQLFSVAFKALLREANQITDFIVESAKSTRK